MAGRGPSPPSEHAGAPSSRPQFDAEAAEMLAAERARRGCLSEPAVEPVDELGHLLELIGDRAEPELTEMLRLDPERARELRDHVVRGNRPVSVHEMVEVAS